MLGLVLALAACGGGKEQGSTPPGHAVPPSLVEEAEEQGSVLVVVALDARGRAEIAAAQEELLDSLGEHGEVAGRPERVPQLAVRVDAEGLEILSRSPAVVAVEPNEPEPAGGS